MVDILRGWTINKKIFFITVVLVIGIAVFAFSLTKKKNEIANTAIIHWMINAPTDQAPATFTMDKIYRDTILAFEKLHPAIKVTLDYFPKNYDYDYIKMLKSDQSPDIIPYGFDNMESIDKENILIDLMGLIAGPQELDMNSLILNSVMYQKKLFVLPYSFSPTVVLYNKSLFNAASIPYPKNDWTWEQFRSISKQLLPGQGSDIAYDIITFEMLSASKGKPIFAPNGDTFVGYLDSPEAVEALKWLNAYYRDDTTKGGPRDPEKSGIAFNHNSKGMVLGDLEAYTFYKAGLGDSLGVASLPHFENGERVNPLYYQGYAISQKSKNPQAAWEFLKYLTLTNQENTTALTNNYLTTSQTIGLTIKQNTDPIKQIFANEINYAIKPSGYTSPYYFQAINQALYTQFQDLLKVPDYQIQSKLHDLAEKLDLEIKRLKTAADQETKTSRS